MRAEETAMEIKLGKGFPAFQSWVNVLKTVNNEATLSFTNEGVKVLTMDPSHVLMVDTLFKAENFPKYNPGEEDTKICLSLNELAQFLKRVDKDDAVSLTHKPERSRLIISIQQPDHNRNFEIPLLEPYDEEVPSPKIMFKASARITHKAVLKAVKDAELVTEHVKISIEERLQITGTGDAGTSFSDWGKDSEHLLEIKAAEAAEATYTLSYVADLISSLKGLAEVVTIELATDMPLKIDAECSDTIDLTFYLAPCIGA